MSDDGRRRSEADQSSGRERPSSSAELHATELLRAEELSRYERLRLDDQAGFALAAWLPTSALEQIVGGLLDQVAAGGWDQPARLFELRVPARLEPGRADVPVSGLHPVIWLSPGDDVAAAAAGLPHLKVDDELELLVRMVAEGTAVDLRGGLLRAAVDVLEAAPVIDPFQDLVGHRCDDQVAAVVLIHEGFAPAALVDQAAGHAGTDLAGLPLVGEPPDRPAAPDGDGRPRVEIRQAVVVTRAEVSGTLMDARCNKLHGVAMAEASAGGITVPVSRRLLDSPADDLMSVLRRTVDLAAHVTVRRPWLALFDAWAAVVTEGIINSASAPHGDGSSKAAAAAWLIRPDVVAATLQRQHTRRWHPSNSPDSSRHDLEEPAVAAMLACTLSSFAEPQPGPVGTLVDLAAATELPEATVRLFADSWERGSLDELAAVCALVADPVVLPTAAAAAVAGWLGVEAALSVLAQRGLTDAETDDIVWASGPLALPLWAPPTPGALLELCDDERVPGWLRVSSVRAVTQLESYGLVDPTARTQAPSGS